MTGSRLLGLCLACLMGGCEPTPQATYVPLEILVAKQFKSWEVARKPISLGPFRIPEGLGYQSSSVGDGISGSFQTPRGIVKVEVPGIAGQVLMALPLTTPEGDYCYAVLKRAR